MRAGGGRAALEDGGRRLVSQRTAAESSCTSRLHLQRPVCEFSYELACVPARLPWRSGWQRARA